MKEETSDAYAALLAACLQHSWIFALGDLPSLSLSLRLRIPGQCNIHFGNNIDITALTYGTFSSELFSLSLVFR